MSAGRLPSRVALLIETDGPGGAETMFLTLAIALRARGLNVLPVVLSGGAGWLSGRLRKSGFEVYQPRLRRAVDPAFIETLRAWFRERQIEIVHAHEFAMAFYGGLAAKLEGLPYVITMHGGTGYAKAMRRRLALSFIARNSRAIVGVSEGTALALATHLWFNRDRIKVVPNGVAKRPGDRKGTRIALGIGEDERLILSVGNLYPVKGHIFLVEAAGLLSEDSHLPPWRLVVAGRGSEEQRLTDRIRQLDLANRFQLLGLRDDIPDLLAASDALVMPSLSEGMPMALLEAMFASIPVICTRVGGIPEVIESGINGVLAEPANPESLAAAMKAVLVDPVGADAMARRARAFVDERYSDRVMADSYIALYAP